MLFVRGVILINLPEKKVSALTEEAAKLKRQLESSQVGVEIIIDTLAWNLSCM